jgi:O-antigen/teichoic acid export membrane protein
MRYGQRLDGPAILSSVTAPDDRERQGADAHHAARSGAIQVLTILAQALLGATQVVFARLFGRSVFGAYLSSLVVLDLFSRGGTGGADKAMLRYVAAARASGDASGVNRAIGTGLRLTLMVAGSFALALALGAPLVASLMKEPALATSLRILAPLPFLTGTTLVLIQATLAARVTRANFLVRGLAEPSLLLAAGLVAWSLGGGLDRLVVAHVSAYAATLVLAVIVAVRIFPRQELRGVWSAPRLPGFVRFALPMAAAEILNALVQRADMIILTALRGFEVAALYGAADFLTRPIASIRGAFDSIVAGVLSETLHLGELDRLRYNLRLTTRWVITVAAPIAVTALTLRRELLGVLYGTAYVDGASAMVALALTHFVNASLGLVGWVLMVAGRSRLGLFNNFLAAAFNVPAAYFLTLRFGLAGAAAATLTTSTLLQALMVIEVAVLHRVHPFSVSMLKPLIAAGVALAVEWAVRGAIATPGLRLLAAIVAGAISYALVLWALRLPEEERRLVQRVLRR